MAVTTTTRIAAATAANTYNFTVDAGSSLSFTYTGTLEASDPAITFLRYDGSGYVAGSIMQDGKPAVLSKSNDVVKFNGPFAGQINKDYTANAVSVVEYA